MLFHATLSIKVKLLIAILVPTVTTLFIGTAVIVRIDVATFREEMISQTKVTAEVVSSYTVSELAFNSPDEAGLTLAKLESISGIEAAVLFDAEDRLFASFSRDPDLSFEAPFFHAGYLLEGGVLHMVEPVVLEGEHYGTLYLRASTRVLEEKIRGYLKGVAFLLFTLIALAVIVAVRLQRVVSTPILRLVDVARTVSSSGDYSTRVVKTGEDEVGALSDAWNDMLAQVELRQDEQRRATEAFQRSEERFRTLTEHSEDAIYVLGPQNHFLYVNPSFERCFGYAAEEILDPGFDDLKLIAPSSQALIVERRERGAQGEKLQQQFELTGISRSGEEIEFEVNTTEIDWDGESARMGILRNITSRKRAEAQLAYSAFYDVLTGLPNRALFSDRLRQAMERARRVDGLNYAVLFLDLDRFKVINDSLGHQFGDRFLCSVADRLRLCMRSEDSVARFGGDEFAVLVENPGDVSEVTHVASRILENFGDAFELEDRQVFSSVSIGIALSSNPYESPEAILRDADIAMYQAKEAGGGRFQVFDTEMHARAMAALQLETELRLALDRGQFELYYQPIIDLNSGSLGGFEALVRWRHPSRGLMAPNEFIGVAEETGIILALDDWVLRCACRQLRHWLEVIDNSPIQLSVNFSSQQFVRRDLLSDVQAAITESGLLNGDGLALEITETALMVHLEAASNLLKQLRPLGIRTSIDDFGTGYSSLSYLRSLPIDTLKIDRSFVSEMLNTPEDLAIVRAIIALSKSLGLKVVAEGIETREQCRRVMELGCDFAQGYWFSRPVSAVDATRILLERRAWLDEVTGGVWANRRAADIEG